MSKFIVIVGVSGAGKSTLLDALATLDTDFVRLEPFTTRPPRPGDAQRKHSISNTEMDERFQRGELIAVNHVYGWRYATPLLPLYEALAHDRYPMTDWMADRLDVIEWMFRDKAFVVHLEPPPTRILQLRLRSSGRDPDGKRFAEAVRDARLHATDVYRTHFDLSVPYTGDRPEDVAAYVRARIKRI